MNINMIKCMGEFDNASLVFSNAIDTK